MLQGNTKNALPVEFLNNIAIERNMSAINFGRDDSNSSKAYLFGLKNGIMYRYTFAIDIENKKVILIEKLT